jgi:hypothetical protein
VSPPGGPDPANVPHHLPRIFFGVAVAFGVTSATASVISAATKSAVTQPVPDLTVRT